MLNIISLHKATQKPGVELIHPCSVTVENIRFPKDIVPNNTELPMVSFCSNRIPVSLKHYAEFHGRRDEGR